MNHKLKNFSIYLIPTLLVAFLIWWCSHTAVKVGYVNTAIVYDGFTLKKELETKYKSVELARQNLLDSIKFKIQYLALKGNNLSDKDKMTFNDLQRSYLNKEKEFERDNELTSQEYSNQIWKQINQYMADYGKEYHYDYILGATGQGNIMFAKESHDLSKEVLEYINHKYSGASAK